MFCFETVKKADLSYPVNILENTVAGLNDGVLYAVVARLGTQLEDKTIDKTGIKYRSIHG